MDDTINNWGGQEMSLAEAAKMLRALSDDDMCADSPERREAILAEQNRAMKMAGILLTGVNKLHDQLKEAKSLAEIRAHLENFYGKLPRFMEHFGLTLENSDAMKILFGMYNEYRNFLPHGAESGEGLIGGKKLEELNSFYVNFAAALQNVNYYRDWKSVEQSVGELVNMTGVTYKDMGLLNAELEVLDPDDEDTIHEIVDKAEALNRKPPSDVLEMFANNETGLEDMAVFAEMWAELKAKVEALLSSDQARSN